MKSMSFETMYWEVAEPQKEQLLNFRATHPVKHLGVGGAQWNYLVGGQGKECVLLLHTHGITAESLFLYVLQFEQTYRVIAPTYPQATTTMTEILEGIVALLEAENIQQVHVFGASIGGFIAQCLVRKYPEKVKSLILSHTMFPSKALLCDAERILKGVSIFPSSLITLLAKQLIQQRLDRQPVQLASTQRTFWLAYLNEMYSHVVTKKDLLAWSKIEVDYHRHYTFPSDDLAEWSGQILLIDSDADEVYSLSQREALKNLYPHAQRYTLRGWGHLGVLAEGNPSVVNDFLNQR